MIARLFIPVIVVTILVFGYFYFTFLRRLKWWAQLLFLLLPVGFIAYTWVLSREQDYFPDDIEQLILYLDLFSMLFVPAVLLAIVSIVLRLLKRQRWLLRAGIATVAIPIGLYLYGKEVGFWQLDVRHTEIAFNDLPQSFDGYKIVLFSDAHLGTLTGRRAAILERAVDSINAQQADLVVFAGDMQNKVPDELKPHMDLLSSVKAKDGVVSVLGNHDYSMYTDRSYEEEYDNEERIRYLHELLKWQLLGNNNFHVYRGQDSIVIAGMENDGEGRFPQLGNIKHALWGITLDQFVVMVEHDPTSWRRRILPESHTQLTLSGHTHAGQFSVFGWSPVGLRYKEYEGLYRRGNRALYVTKGLGGVIPFRLGASGEIVVITLRKQ